MRRIWAVCAALVLLASWGAGCSGPPASDQGEIKQAFIRQLVGFCAEVDRQLAKIDVKGQPGIVADQFARFVGQARSQPAPDADRAQFEILLTEIDGVVRYFRSAQTALTADDQPAYQEALTQADQQLESADSAAQKYGMPPLNSCPEHESTASASATTSTTQATTMPPVAQPPVVPPPSKAPPSSIRVNAGSGGAADPADRGTGLDTATVLLLVGGLLMLTGGLMLVRRRVS